MSKESSIEENNLKTLYKPRSKPFLQSFSRKKSRSYSVEQADLMEKHYPSVRIDDEVTNLESLIGGNKTINLEIGFGAGEHLLHQAKLNPNEVFIGAEVFMNGVASCFQQAYRNKISNIIFYDGDSRVLLSKMPKKYISKIYLLFADPWPKKRHHKRRIFNLETLGLFHKVLKDDGLIRVATDHPDYYEWMEEICSEQNLFNVSFVPQPEDHIITRFQQKALNEGRQSRFIHLKK